MDHDETTLFEDVRAVPAGCNLHVSGRDLTSTTERYYDVAARSGETFQGSMKDGVDEYAIGSPSPSGCTCARTSG